MGLTRVAVELRYSKLHLNKWSRIGSFQLEHHMSNKAAWLTAAKARPFKVDDAPMPTPEPHEVVIRNYATAINPADYGIQDSGIIIEKYPFILSCDAAGEVTAVGSAVTTFTR